MKLNRRDIIKTALIGIPGLVLLPTALKAKSESTIDEPFVYEYVINDDGVRQHHLLVGINNSCNLNVRGYRFEIASWHSPSPTPRDVTLLSVYDVDSFMVSHSISDFGRTVIKLKNGMQVEGIADMLKERAA